MIDLIGVSIEAYPDIEVKRADSGTYRINIDLGPEQDHKYCVHNGVLGYSVFGRVLSTKMNKDRLDTLIENEFEKDEFCVPFSNGEVPVNDADLAQYKIAFGKD
jgi:hypothetical protein